MNSETSTPIANQQDVLVGDLNWNAVHSDLTNFGHAIVPNLITHESCDTLIESYDEDELYRSTIKMERYSFGKGEYRYYRYPLPNIISNLRNSLYPGLANIANGWNRNLGIEPQFPESHASYINQCHEAGQLRPTPLILRYGAGDYNCLHQDLYGDMVFPLQLAVMLNQSGEDYTGGELVLTEQRPRMQSRAEVITLNKGDAVIFPVNERPVKGSRGYYRVKIRHGVSRVKSGKRHVLGIIFHDAK